MVELGQLLYEVYPMLDAPLKDLVEHLKSYSKIRGNAWIIRSAFTRTKKLLKKNPQKTTILNVVLQIPILHLLAMTAKTHYQQYLNTKHIWLVCRRLVFPLEFHAMEAANYNGCQRID